jgi:hypothetical protein
MPDVRWRNARPYTGTLVDVRSAATHSTWLSGFEVVSIGPQGYRLRRLTDGAILPSLVPFDDVRPRPVPAGVG